MELSNQSNEISNVKSSLFQTIEKIEAERLIQKKRHKKAFNILMTTTFFICLYLINEFSIPSLIELIYMVLNTDFSVQWLGHSLFVFCSLWFFLGPMCFTYLLMTIFEGKYHGKYKEIFVQKVVADLGNFDYSPQSDLTEEYLEQLGIFPSSFCTLRSEDRLSGVYNDYEFIIRELHLKYSSDEHHNVFGGILVATRLDRSVQSKILIAPKWRVHYGSEMQRRHNIEVRTAFNGLFKTVGIGGVKDASSKALYSNNKFAVHSSEPERARKLITGEFFEEYSKNFDYGLYVEDDVCIFAIPWRDTLIDPNKTSFDVSSLHKPDYYKDADKIRKQVLEILEVVDSYKKLLRL